MSNRRLNVKFLLLSIYFRSSQLYVEIYLRGKKKFCAYYCNGIEYYYKLNSRVENVISVDYIVDRACCIEVGIS